MMTKLFNKIWHPTFNRLHFLVAGALLLMVIFGQSAAQAQPVTLNLKDANITAVINTVSQVTNKNFIVDPRVKGKVTIISARPMDKEELYQVFLSILEVHGFAAIPSGDVIKIIPDASAKQNAVPLADGTHPGLGAEDVTRVVELNNVSASQLVPILRPLVPQQGHLAAYVPSNFLIISDHAANIDRLIEIIKRIDLPSSDAIEVIRLQHASANEVVRIITTLNSQSAGKQGNAASGKPLLVADARSNSLLIGGSKSGRLRLRTIISHLDTPLESDGGDTHVVYLKYAQASSLVSVLTGVSNSALKKGGKKTGGAARQNVTVDIQADENTNALVITASPAEFRSLKAVIDKLDMRRAQVQVEAIIADVSSDLNSELGVQWLLDSTPGGNGPVGLSNFGSGSGSSITETLGALALGGVPAIGDGLTLGLGVFNSSNFNFASVIHALRGNGATNILSTPSLVMLDNEEAEIVVGQNVPFITGSYSGTGGSAATPTNPFQTITRENVGITLKVKPQINEGDAIKLDIEQKIDSLAATALSAADLITNTRSIKTSVIVDDQQTIVLGGLIRDDVTESEQKVPLLGDIPFLGALFSNKKTTKSKVNLMVFLKPTIIKDNAVSNALTSEKYNFIRAKQLEISKQGLLMMPNEHSPVLPAFDELLVIPPSFQDSDTTTDEDPAVTQTTP